MNKIFCLLLSLFIINTAVFATETYLYCEYQGNTNKTMGQTFIFDIENQKAFILSEGFKFPLPIIKFTPYEIIVDISIDKNTANVTFDRVEGKSIIHGTNPNDEFFVIGKCSANPKTLF